MCRSAMIVLLAALAGCGEEPRKPATVPPASADPAGNGAVATSLAVPRFAWLADGDGARLLVSFLVEGAEEGPKAVELLDDKGAVTKSQPVKEGTAVFLLKTKPEQVHISVVGSDDTRHTYDWSL